jgi:hypothetical protein
MYIAIYVLYHTVHLYSVHTYVCTVYGIWYIYSSSILVYYIISQFSKKLKVVVHVAVEKKKELTRTNNLGNGNKNTLSAAILLQFSVYYNNRSG